MAVKTALQVLREHVSHREATVHIRAGTISVLGFTWLEWNSRSDTEPVGVWGRLALYFAWDNIELAKKSGGQRFYLPAHQTARTDPNGMEWIAESLPAGLPIVLSVVPHGEFVEALVAHVAERHTPFGELLAAVAEFASGQVTSLPLPKALTDYLSADLDAVRSAIWAK